jgi:hypothetical protein
VTKQFDILMVADEDLDLARRHYREEYGVLPDDKSVDKEIEKRFEWAENAEPPDHLVHLPKHLVLALMLREGWGGRGRGRKGRHPAIGRAILKARKRKASLIKSGVKRGKAEEQAAEEAFQSFKQRGFHPSSVSRIRRMMQSDK